MFKLYVRTICAASKRASYNRGLAAAEKTWDPGNRNTPFYLTYGRTYERTVVQRRLYVSALWCQDKKTCLHPLANTVM